MFHIRPREFPGYSKSKIEVVSNKRGKQGEGEKVETKFEPKAHRGKIFGNHATTYINTLTKEDSEKFKRQFSEWEK